MKAESRKPAGHERVVQLLEASQKGLQMNLNVQEVAALTGLSVSTLALYRQKGGGPKFFKISGSRAIRYRLNDVIEYMNASPIVKSSKESGFSDE